MIDQPLYLSPVNLPESIPDSLGRQIIPWRQEEDIPSGKKTGVMIVGVPEDRFFEKGGLALSPTAIRWQLYHLAEMEDSTPFLDAGDITPGADLSETYARLAEVIRVFTRAGWTTLILGGGSDLMAGQYLALEEKQSRGQMVFVNSRLELSSSGSGEQADWNHFLYGENSGLLHYTHIGHQSHYTSYKKINILKDKHFDLIRLSESRTKLEETEPFFRDADSGGISMNALRFADAPGAVFPSPNGFTGEEICQLSFYAGLSNHLRSFGIYDLNESDTKGITTEQAAQIAWYFLEGAAARILENPLKNTRNIKKYIVPMDGKFDEMIFYKSLLTERWWMEIPHTRSSSSSGKTLIACSVSDYEKACKREVPDRWWKWAQVIP
jgi:arginase family enzyme